MTRTSCDANVQSMTTQRMPLERLEQLTSEQRLGVLAYLTGYLGADEMADAIRFALPELAESA